MIAYYGIMAALAVLNLIIFIALFTDRKINFYLVLLLAILTISNLGNLALALSDTVYEAYLAKKIYYIGGCFAAPIILTVIIDMCKIQVSKWIRNIIYIFSFVVYGMILSIGYADIYYKDMELHKFGNATAVTPVYGFGHSIFYVLLYGYMLIGIAILIYSLKRKNTISRKNLWALVGMELATILLFLVVRPILPHVEVTPLVYVVDGWIFLYINRRVTLYNVEENIMSSLKKQYSYGYVMFDNNRNYLGSNTVAMELIPELELCKVDKPLIKHENLTFIEQWLDEFRDDEDPRMPYIVGDKYYEGNVERIWHGDNGVGFIIELADQTEHRKYTKLLNQYNTDLQMQVNEQTAHIRDMQAKVLLGMANMVENRDDNTGGHIKRTSHVIGILIDTIQKHQLLPLDEEFCQDIVKAAPMHDLGKIGIDDGILKKPGRLTDEEFAIMQTHAEKSAVLVESILKDVEEEHFVRVAINMARNHHEKWNGFGYPDRLKGEDIPIEARIMAIADVYDALVSKRCYKEAMSFEEAFKVMEESMGSHFDPQMEQVFLLSREKLEAYYRT